MLTVFVMGIGWMALDAWRPWQETRRCVQSPAHYLSVRRSTTVRLDEQARLPGYNWFAQDPATNPFAGRFKLPIGQSPAYADLALEGLLEDRKRAVWETSHLAGSQASFAQLSDDELLLAWRFPHDRQRTDSSRVDTADRSGLAAYPSAAWWRQAGRAMARITRWDSLRKPQLGTPSYSPYSPVKRYASPPSLLRVPLVANEDDRLAMIPRRPVETRRSQRDWPKETFCVARPYLANSLDQQVNRSLFSEPTKLVQMLVELSHEPECSRWAIESLRTLGELTADVRPNTISPSTSLARLAYLSQAAEDLAAETVAPGLATRLRRARYAMWRRVECWQAAYALIAPPVDRLTLAAAEQESKSAGVQPLAVAVSSPPRVDELLALVEEFELHEDQQTADEIAVRLAQLASSPDVRERDFAESISTHYRNANVRIAIASDLINRLLPTPAPRTEAVRGRILGTPVNGSATSSVQPRIELLADPAAWRLGLEVQGQVEASTIALERTVRVRTTGTTCFAARQQMVIDHTGMRRGPVVAKANSTTRFQSARSRFDMFPLVGNIVRSQAASTFVERRSRAEREVAEKTARRVESRMAAQVENATAQIERDLQTRWLDPLAARGIQIEPIELATTNERLVGRVRIASENRLTAHTPRPRAPSDSLASLQLHESGLAHLAAGLQLDGQRFTARQFREHLAEVFPHRAATDLDDDADQDAEETVFHFADRDTVTFSLADGQAQLTLAVRELVVRKKSLRDFKVHVYYQPQADGLVAQFVHEAGPYFEGRLRNAERMTLQTVFGKVFPEDGVIPIGGRLADDPRLAGLMITQLVIDDGWLAVALGPAQPQRTAQLDRYAPLY